MKKFTIICLLLAAACMPAAGQSQKAIRVNCGGSGYTDSKGQFWQADTGYNGGLAGNPVTGTIAGTADQKLHQTARYAKTNGSSIKYFFPVTAGSYHVNLYFSETNPGASKVGGRVFDVKLQGNTSFKRLDVFAAVGANSALIKGADIIATDGQVEIELDSIVQVAKIDAIEITQSVAMPQLNLNFVYPDGTPVAGSLNYKVTSGTAGGANLSGNEPLKAGHVTCLLVSSPQVLGLMGTLNVSLSLTDAAGHSLWQIALSLNPATANFTAVQSSSMSVVVQKQ